MNGNNDGHNNREYTNIIEERNNRKMEIKIKSFYLLVFIQLMNFILIL